MKTIRREQTELSVASVAHVDDTRRPAAAVNENMPVGGFVKLSSQDLLGSVEEEERKKKKKKNKEKEDKEKRS